MREEIWPYCADLKAYRAAPTPEETEALTARFESLFGQRTGEATSCLAICVFDKFNPMKYRHKIQLRKGR